MADVRGPIIQEDIDPARVRHYTDFFESDFGKGPYKDKISKMIGDNQTRLLVSLDDLRNWDALRTQSNNNGEVVRETKSLLNQPMEHLPALDRALKDTIMKINVDYINNLKNDLHVGLEGSFGTHALNPRTLSARYLGKLVSIEGIVTRCSVVRPKVVKSVHYCEVTKSFSERNYRDITSPGVFNITPSIYPTEDADGNPLVTEYGLCTYRDHQSISIQEMPEKAPAGQLPRSVDIILDDDLVDRIKPGDRVEIVGVYRALPFKSQGSTSGVFRTMILANNVHMLGKDVSQMKITEVDIRNIQTLAKKKNILDILSQSLAPSIFGQENIKKAILLLLLGGVERNLANGTHIRGDINLLMVGDPSTAKSQFLRFILNVAPLAIATTGRGASGVGLTAAVTTDRDTGDRRLEAGAMVLADRGVVCIDEFDKMNDVDRVAMHEVMEQQTVTIAKAGIHASLNARCSVVAAANPVYGQYNRQKKPTDNIGLPDSLLSRFDLLFIVLDHMNPEHDKSISMHVLHMHQYRKPGEEEGVPVVDDVDLMERDDENNDEEDTPMFEKYDHYMVAPGQKRRAKREVLTMSFLKKYLFFAKHRYHPKLTKDAADLIMKTYAQLRSQEDTKTLPVTARTLETLIRLASAHAKARLSRNVEEIDAEAADSIMKYALYNETEVEKRRKRRRARQDVGGDDDDDDDGDEGGNDDDEYKGRAPKSAAAASDSHISKAPRAASGQQDDQEDEEDDDQPLIRRAPPARTDAPMDIAGPALAAPRPVLTPERIRRFQVAVREAFSRGVETMHVDALMQKLPELPQSQGGNFQIEEVELMLAVMESENKLMVRDHNIFLIS